MKKGRIRVGAAFVAAALVCALAPAAASAASFSNTSPITINDFPGSGCATGPTSGTASPYPSQIEVSGLGTPASDVNATITGYSHTFPDDVRMLLVGPHGQTADLMDEVGGGGGVSGGGVSDLTITFDDAAADPVPNVVVSGTFKPTQAAGGCGLGPTDDFPTPAPANPYGIDLAGFNGTDPNGTWSLYVVDDANADSGSISGGWSLDIAAPAVAPSPTPNANCAKLRKKLKRQKQHLAAAATARKQSKIQANIQDTKRRLQRLGC
jgi:hypothetical protein